MPSSTNPVIPIYSIVLASCSHPTLNSCVSHSCAHCLAVFPLTLLISPTNALLHDSIYKTPTMDVIKNVQISTLTIVLIVYLTSGHSNITLKLPNSNFWTSRNTLALIWNPTLPSIKATLCSKLTSKLPDTDYRNTWTHESRLVQLMSWSYCPNHLWILTSGWVVQCTNS